MIKCGQENHYIIICFIKFNEISGQRVAEHKLGAFVPAIKVKIVPYYNEAVLGRSVG